MNDFYDVIISGCGPSGSLLGYYLAQHSIKTLIIEKEHFPRKKICAGGVQHRVLKFIPFDIRHLAEKTVKGIYFSIRNKNVFQKKHTEPIMYTIRREILDSFLAEKAVSAGCTIYFGEKVQSLNIMKNHAEVKTGSKTYRAKIVAAADGSRGSLHRHILKGEKINKIIGYETDIEYPSADDTVIDSAEQLFDLSDSVRLDFKGVKKGYCWVFPKEKSMSCGMGAPWKDAAAVKAYLKKFLQQFCLPDGCSSKGTDRYKLSAHSIPVRKNKTPFCGFRIIAAGDAACFGDGFTGEGLYNAVKSACYAADSIKKALKNSDFSFSDYYENISNDIARDIMISLFLNKIFYNSFSLLYKLIEKKDNYFNACCRFLRGEKNYNDIVERLKIFKF